MSIRLRLLLSYAAMLLIPLIMIILTSLLLVMVFHGDVQNIRDAYGDKANFFHDGRYMKEIKRNTEKNPSIFLDKNYLDDLNQEMQTTGASLIVRNGDRITYVSGQLQQPELIRQLPPFEHAGSRDEESAKRYDNQLLTVTQIDFLFADNRPGSIFIVSQMNPIVNFARKFFPIVFVALIVILVLTHSVLTYFVSKSIIGPLRLLKNAAKQIKQGDLDFHVKVKGKDEIGQLGIAFEEMRSQLQQSIQTQLQYEENRKELISNISHDLKTPLTSIKGYVEGIQDGVAYTPEKMGKYIKTISSKAEEMDRLIDELFLYSKLDLKRVPFHFEHIRVAAFLQDWADELRFDLEKQGFRFDFEMELQPDTEVSVDRDKLKRVFSNIIDNCVKYMDKADKQIRLTAYAAGDSVKVEISDNGQGIEQSALPYVFERFYRAEQSRNTHTGGSGLGLAIAKQIMEGHHGTIQAQSTQGEGATMILSLPIKNA
jgi:signal transduction histidine kinase